METKYCESCGEVIAKEAEICPKCGVRSMKTKTSGKTPGMAAFLSFLIPGVGQIYNGEVGKGIFFFVSATILVFILVGFLIWLYGIVDAYNVAQKK